MYLLTFSTDTPIIYLADENAAINILVAGGHPVPARGGFGIGQPVKHEPLLLAGIPGL